MSGKNAKITSSILRLLHYTGMKFRNRLVILFGIVCITFTFYIILGDIALIEDTQFRQIRLAESHLWPYKPSNHASWDSAVCSAGGNLKPTADIFTIDLKDKTNYEISSDANYILPTPDYDYTKRSRTQLLNVILMPHSHNDAGWLKKIKEYYADQTKHILNNMVDKLTTYPNMTFVWAETVFLSMWWKELEDGVKARVRRLIHRGQLEIVSGGWVMPDEAGTHYVSAIDQLVEGHQWVWENLRVKPINSWSIDPFGHSATMPYIWKLSGMDNMVIQRVHQATKGALAEEKHLEFQWRQFWDKTGKSDILCHIMPYVLYGIRFTCGPNRFTCHQFDYRYIPEEGKRLLARFITSDNIQIQAKLLYEQYIQKAFLYNYNVILIPLGDDFRFDKATEWDQQYQNYDLLMKYMNKQKDWKINVKFGTLKDYFKLLRKSERRKTYDDSTKDIPSLSGDFFPYSDKNLDYWTGYFSTRPYHKRLYRLVESDLRAADILHTLAFAYCKSWGKEYHYIQHTSQLLREARRNLALFLHHDAVTGTSKDYVMQDYESKLNQARNFSHIIIRRASQLLLSNGMEQKHIILNTTYHKETLTITENPLTVYLFNPLPHYRQEMIHLNVDIHTVVVRNSRGDDIPCQINPVWDHTNVVSATTFEIVFPAELTPLGFVSYQLHKSVEPLKNSFSAKIAIYNTRELAVPPDTNFIVARPVRVNSRKVPIVLENKHMKVIFDSLNGTLKEVIDKVSGNRSQLDIEFMAYKSRGSGAYIFYPTGDSKPVIVNIPIVRVIQGPILSEIHMVHQNVLHKVKLYHVFQSHANALHIENLVNILDLKDREIIMRFKTNIKNKDLSFFTDSNGYQLIQRKTIKQLLAQGNYYPMTTMAHIEDSLQRFTLLSEQPLGVAALEQGWLEVMLDRMLLYDDARGLGEGVMDNRPVISKFVILLESKRAGVTENAKFTFPSLQAMTLSDAIIQHPIILYPEKSKLTLMNNLQFVSKSFPCDLTIVSLRNLLTSNIVYNGTSLIIHRRGYSCGFSSSGLQCDSIQRPISFIDLFREFPVHQIKETSLTHLHDKSTLRVSDNIDIDTMEIKSYLVHF